MVTLSYDDFKSVAEKVHNCVLNHTEGDPQKYQAAMAGMLLALEEITGKDLKDTYDEIMELINANYTLERTKRTRLRCTASLRKSRPAI